jgi:hypothetical protein
VLLSNCSQCDYFSYIRSLTLLSSYLCSLDDVIDADSVRQEFLAKWSYDEVIKGSFPSLTTVYNTFHLKVLYDGSLTISDFVIPKELFSRNWVY